MNLLKRYMNWLHLRWPAGTVEPLPEVDEHFRTNVPGLYVVGDLTGVPLLKLSADSGVRAVRHLCADPAFKPGDPNARDLVIIGAGVAGFAAALEARTRGLNYVLLEAHGPFATLHNFPKGKPIYTYPSDMEPAGALQFKAKVKEALVAEVEDQTREITVTSGRAERVRRSGSLLEVELAGAEPIRAQRVIVAIGRSGNHRKLGVPGEARDKVYNRLHDPADYADRDVLVVGGGDSALETAIAIAEKGGRVTLAHRKPELARPKPDNLEQLESFVQQGRITLALATEVRAIDERSVTLAGPQGERTIVNDVVFAMIGREAPLDFFRRSGCHIAGETRPSAWIALALFSLFVILLYDWKTKSWLEFLWHQFDLSASVTALFASLGSWWQTQAADRTTLIGTIATSMLSRGFYYASLYTAAIAYFGIRRIRRRRTPYVTIQTTCLFLIQLFPLFLLPEVILPYLDYNGVFQSGLGRRVMDQLFELYISPQDFANQVWPSWGHPRAYWRAYGLIFAWPLSVYNFSTATVNWAWLTIGLIQTFVLIPLLVWRWGKGAYCGWICSCGALAETMGDAHRQKMPHGPKINRLNFIGQFFLLMATLLLFWRVLGWAFPGGFFDRYFGLMLDGKHNGQLVNPLAYGWFVDVLFAGILGVVFYFKYSGRVWCRFACPLAALMHIYARFSSFRIFADKKKCISCNVCTSVCHQGIDIMSFANKGLPMEDPQCVRCSACVQSCPTGTLQFGRIDRQSGEVLAYDRLQASPVRSLEV